MSEKTFPFNLSDLKYFIIRRKDGLTIKYNIIDPAVQVGGSASTAAVHVGGGATSNFTPMGRWCKHVPADKPLFTTPRVDLYIADCQGFRGHYNEFNYALDCGDILTQYQVNGPATELLDGDKVLVKKLNQFIMKSAGRERTKVLQIDWDDRRAPKLNYGFWKALVDGLEGTALIACQGGHGRSGTGAVCMMMIMNPEYSPADAIIHLRAMHCARAIESKEQHEYIGKFGEFLGRVNDIDRIGKVNSFKEAFLDLKLKSAKPYQEQLLADMSDGKVEKVDKEAEYVIT